MIAISAASRTRFEPQVRALADGLIATDDTRIDIEPLILAAVTDVGHSAQPAGASCLLRAWRHSAGWQHRHGSIPG
jgi:hypothetical protein